MDYQTITTEQELQQYCRELASAESIALDTEFVSEHTYRPVLCLIQVAADGRLAVIDPIEIGDVRPFWEVLARGRHETIVHAGRGDLEFCLEAIGSQPENLFDVQIAAAFVGIEYPAGYSKLIARLLDKKPHKHETRTDWRRRPLSNRQIQYAVDDARFLKEIRDLLYGRLQKLDRLSWFQEEMAHWRKEVERAQSGERWRRVSGNTGLKPRTLAVVRELWRWRESEAGRRNTPIRRVLRDDLIVELAKRQSADPKRISAVRGLERGDLKRRMGEISEAIQRGLELPDEECPKPNPSARRPKHSVLGQFLFAALSSICRRSDLASTMVGTQNDIRDLIAYQADAAAAANQRPPRLAQGWRAKFVGDLFEDLLAGKVSIRIQDPTSDHPLVLEPRDA